MPTLKEHKKHTKTFPNLSFMDQSRSINATIRWFIKATANHAKKGGLKVYPKVIGQLRALANELQDIYDKQAPRPPFEIVQGTK